ncbi:MAG: metabolite traffic protein EboE [Lentisphaerae bacterium]|nr:metabolite traffic protein EboE [Lentisphaerota bacterium]
MRFPGFPSVHLAYCLNVHRGETWEENLEAIRTFARAVRDRVDPPGEFGLGLRISRHAASDLARPGVLAAFRKFLSDNGLYVFTINGFPYGAFHGTRVKEAVYQPDWTSEERRIYTEDLAVLLAGLLPDGVNGSISTVPGSYASWIRTDAQRDAMVQNLARCALSLRHLEERTGRRVEISLEPEPGCVLESTDDVIRFFREELVGRGTGMLQEIAGMSPGDAEVLLRRYVGVCLDCCHLALRYEDPAESLSRLHAAGIRVGKIHLSAAPTLGDPVRHFEALLPFDDPVYLHQVRGLNAEGEITAYTDLPDAMAVVRDGRCADVEWRVHCHVPLYFEGSGPLGTTAKVMSPGFFSLARDVGVAHIEIETYTYDVLPPEARLPDLVDSIAAEYAWVMSVPGVPDVPDVETGFQAGSTG